MVSARDLESEITDLVHGFLAELTGQGAQPVSDDTDLVADLMLDSLDFLALLTRIEQRWDLKIPDEDTNIENFATVGAVRAYVRRALADR
jgi:acyl carrier protein